MRNTRINTTRGVRKKSHETITEKKMPDGRTGKASP